MTDMTTATMDELAQAFDGPTGRLLLAIPAVVALARRGRELDLAVAEKQRALEALQKKIEDTKVAELARADQAQADFDVAQAQRIERLALLDEKVTAKSAALGDLRAQHDQLQTKHEQTKQEHDAFLVKIGAPSASG